MYPLLPGGGWKKERLPQQERIFLFFQNPFNEKQLIENQYIKNKPVFLDEKNVIKKGVPQTFPGQTLLYIRRHGNRRSKVRDLPEKIC